MRTIPVEKLLGYAKLLREKAKQTDQLSKHGDDWKRGYHAGRSIELETVAKVLEKITQGEDYAE